MVVKPKEIKVEEKRVEKKLVNVMKKRDIMTKAKQTKEPKVMKQVKEQTKIKERKVTKRVKELTKIEELKVN